MLLKKITKETVQLTEKGWKTEIPIEQKIDTNCIRKLINVSEKKSEYESLLVKLALAKPWMDEINRGNDIVLEVEEWINKSSGIGKFTIILNNKSVIWVNGVMTLYSM